MNKKFKTLIVLLLLLITVLFICLIFKQKQEKRYPHEGRIQINESFEINKNNKTNKMNKTIYVYWDSGLKGMKPLIKTFYLNNKKISKKYNYNYVLITKENISKFIDVPERFYKLAPNFQSDICRFYILDKYGGIWMDTDIILYENMDKLVDKMDKKDMLILEEFTNKIGCAFIIARKKSKVISFCKKYVEDILNSNKDMYWNIIGPDTITEGYKRYKNYILLLTNSDNINKSINFYDWRTRVETKEHRHIWLKKNKKEAIDVSKKIKQYNYPIIITWTLYKTCENKDMRHRVEAAGRVCDDEINKMVFKNDKSIFYHLMNNE